MLFGNKKATIKVYHCSFETFAVVAHQQEKQIYHNIHDVLWLDSCWGPHIFLLHKSISRQPAENEIEWQWNIYYSHIYYQIKRNVVINLERKRFFINLLSLQFDYYRNTNLDIYLNKIAIINMQIENCTLENANQLDKREKLKTKKWWMSISYAEFVLARLDYMRIN